MKLVDRIMDYLKMYSEEEVFDDELDIQKPLDKEDSKKEKLSLFRKKNIEGDSSENLEKDSNRKSVLSFKNNNAKATEANKMSSKTINLPVANKMISVIVLEPISFDDSQKIADYLKSSQPVVVNFEKTDRIVAKRMTDFISGTIYAVGGNLKKLGKDILVCAPKNVDIDAGADVSNDHIEEQFWKR